MLGEFGRTPRISELTPGAVPGRDHWPFVFPAVFAGAGIAGGQVIGKSDRLGRIPVTRSFGPPDLAATIYSALGVDPATELRDRFGRPLRLCGPDHRPDLFGDIGLRVCSRRSSEPHREKDRNSPGGRGSVRAGTGSGSDGASPSRNPIPDSAGRYSEWLM